MKGWKRKKKGEVRIKVGRNMTAEVIVKGRTVTEGEKGSRR